jgi:GntR family transcriptional regulator/MocR family aminotransferase
MMLPLLDKTRPLARQIYTGIRERILSGSLPPGMRMTSTRDMARQWGVSRTIVINAFEQLSAEGFVEARRGSGSYVAAGASWGGAAQRSRKGRSDAVDLAPPPTPPRGCGAFRTDRVDFRSGLPDLTRFPVATWQKLSRQVWSVLTPMDLSYGQPEGNRELREQICRLVGTKRGVRCHPDQVLVTAGTTQAVGIVTRLLIAPDRSSCILEDPITNDIVRIVENAGGTIEPVPVDDQGIRTDALPRGARPAMIYITPSHQFPTGATLPIQRRVSILQYARSHATYVVEDDYDSEFRFDAPPISSLQGLEPSCVIYIGTFSKTLFPSLRIGFVILPPALVARGRELKWFSDLHNSSPDQLVLARFIADGHFARYVHLMGKVYARRRAALVGALDRAFGSGVRVLGSPAGIHLCARFAGVRFTRSVVEAIDRAGVVVYPAEAHAIRKGRFTDTLLFGYGMLDIPRIEEGIVLLGRAFARLNAR